MCKPLFPSHLYHALDFLAEHKEEIEEFLFRRVRSLFDCELDLAFWDTTSTYFEGSGSGKLRWTPLSR
ncbi:hypothetical protein [Desulfovirgula thermocuniculi]|uniref:hypothetical protein n=1 Tax=Desulfovirgula thermocuniculi TaxID=348842 RepID=UPI0003F5DAFC